MFFSKTFLVLALIGGQILASDLLAAPVLAHGPVVGGTTDSAANVFVRTDQAGSVSLRYGTDPNLATYQESRQFITSSSADFTQIIPLAGLSAETTYYLNVVVGGLSQMSPPYPSFKTFPVAGSTRDFKFAVLTDFVTVAKLDRSFRTFSSAAARSPAFVFIGGDFDHTNPQTIPERRAMFKTLYDPATPYMDGFVTEILRKSPIMHQWDDHDSGLNNVDKTYANWGDTQQVFEEYMPSYPLPAVKPGNWQRFSYAQVDYFVLDCRSQRDSELDGDDANKSMLDGNNLGATGQLQWLENGLLTSSARWKVIFTSVVINPTTKFPDGWAGYQTEWNGLRSFIESNHITGVVFISGDLHLSAIDDGTNVGFPEMCVSQANAARKGFCSTGSVGHWSEGYYDDRCSGFGLVTIMQNPDRLILETVDENGVVHLSYTVSEGTPTPTPTPTPAPPVITAQPANVTVKIGEPGKFSVTATGGRPLHYQWKKNALDIAGAHKATYTTPPTTQGDNGSLFSVLVSNSVGSVLSENAKLKVKESRPGLARESAHARDGVPIGNHSR